MTTIPHTHGILQTAHSFEEPQSCQPGQVQSVVANKQWHFNPQVANCIVKANRYTDKGNSPLPAPSAEIVALPPNTYWTIGKKNPWKARDNGNHTATVNHAGNRWNLGVGDRTRSRWYQAFPQRIPFCQLCEISSPHLIQQWENFGGSDAQTSQSITEMGFYRSCYCDHLEIYPPCLAL